jgi:hypothetical protein
MDTEGRHSKPANRADFMTENGNMHLGKTSRIPTTGAAGGSRRAGARGRSWLPALVAALALVVFAAPQAGANDLSTYPCTAGDVEIVGSGVIVNEPCQCDGGSTFDARVQFTVRNNTSTGRYCIALHLVQDGTILTEAVDVVLYDANGNSTAPGKSGGARYKDTIMFGTIPNFPCNSGVVCFGEPGVTRGKCDAGECTTISWNTSPGNAGCTLADQSPPGGQCRHQQVCIVGFGASLECAAGCEVACGGSATLRACAVGPADRGPYTLTVAGDDGSSQSQSTLGDESGTACLDFTVNPTKSPVTTYTLTVTDKNGCTRTATATVNVTPTTVAIAAPTTPPCNGVLVYTASVPGMSGCSFTWTVDGQSLASFASGGGAFDARVAQASGTGSNTLSFRALDGLCHTIRANASCSDGSQTPCTGTATVTAKQCVGTTKDCSP